MSCQSPDPANTVTDRLNQLLSSGGNGYVLSLCPGRQYFITQPLAFAAPNQEISTQGYPTGPDRASLVVSGPVSDGTGHTTAMDGTCANCSGVKLRNVQVCSYQMRTLCFKVAEIRHKDQWDEGWLLAHPGRCQHRDGRQQLWAAGEKPRRNCETWG